MRDASTVSVGIEGEKRKPWVGRTGFSCAWTFLCHHGRLFNACMHVDMNSNRKMMIQILPRLNRLDLMSLDATSHHKSNRQQIKVVEFAIIERSTVAQETFNCGVRCTRRGSVGTTASDMFGRDCDFPLRRVYAEPTLMMQRCRGRVRTSAWEEATQRHANGQAT